MGTSEAGPKSYSRYFSAAYINHSSRTDRKEEFEMHCRVIGVEAARISADLPEGLSNTVVATEWDTSLNTLFDQMNVPPGRGPLSSEERGYAAAHVALWEGLATSADRPLLVLEDNIVAAAQFGLMVAHFVKAVEDIVPIEERCCLVHLSGIPGAFREPWLPTKLKTPQREPVVLREVEYCMQSGAYLIWPLAAKRLLSSLPLNVPVDHFISRHGASSFVRTGGNVVAHHLSAHCTNK